MRPQTRVRKMRQPGQHHGRSTDGIRQVYYDEIIRAARAADHPAPELVLVTDDDGNLTDAYIDHYPESPESEDQT